MCSWVPLMPEIGHVIKPVSKFLDWPVNAVSTVLRVDEVRWSTDGRATGSQELPGRHRASRLHGRDCAYREHRRVSRSSSGPDHRPQHHQEGPRGQDGRQGGRVQSVVSSDPSHEARQPALQARNAGLGCGLYVLRHGVPKKRTAFTSSNLNRFSNFFHRWKDVKFPAQPL